MATINNKNKTNMNVNGTANNKNNTNMNVNGTANNSLIEKVYVYMGHGSVLVDNEELVRDIVPSNCTYSTIANVGFTSKLASILLLNTLSLDNIKMLQTPLKHVKELNNLFTGRHLLNSHTKKSILTKGNYHLKVGGSNFTNNTCSFLLQFVKHDGMIYIYTSGLHDMSLSTSPAILYNMNSENMQGLFIINPKEGIKIEIIKSIYNGSVYPTSDEIIAQLITDIPGLDINNSTIVPYNKFVSAVGECVKDNTSKSTMVRFPGNHYNFSCRSFFNVQPKTLNINSAINESNNEANKILIRPYAIYKKLINKIIKKFKPQMRQIYYQQELILKFLQTNPQYKNKEMFQEIYDEIISNIRKGTFTKDDIDPYLSTILKNLVRDGIITNTNSIGII